MIYHCSPLCFHQLSVAVQQFLHFGKPRTIAPCFLLGNINWKLFQCFNIDILKTGFCFCPRLNIKTRGEGDSPSNGLYGEVPPEGGTFSRLKIYRKLTLHKIVALISEPFITVSGALIWNCFCIVLPRSGRSIGIVVAEKNARSSEIRLGFGFC